MVTDDVLLAADANMRDTWRTMASSGPSPTIVERDGLLLVASGLPFGLFNPAFVTRAPDDAAALVDGIAAHYRDLGLPFVLYFRDAYSNGFDEAAAAAGLVEHYRPPLMVLDPIVPSPRPPAGVEIVVTDDTTLDDYRRVLAEGFGMPLDFVRAAFGPELLDIEPLTALLAFVDGEPASTSAVFVTGEIAGVYNVATTPAMRGRGVGAAVTWAAVAAGAAAGCTRSILQASAEGAPVYTRMGFDTSDRYRQFEPA